jgi:hypothetical protein
MTQEENTSANSTLAAIAALFLFFVGAPAVLVLWISISDPEPLLPDQKIEHVARVLEHEPGRWTVFIQRSDTPELERLSLRGSSRWIADVPPGEEMWLVIRSVRCGTKGRCEDNEFHIRSVKDIQGAGWNHGKFGSGQTVVIR